MMKKVRMRKKVEEEEEEDEDDDEQTTPRHPENQGSDLPGFFFFSFFSTAFHLLISFQRVPILFL